MDGSWSPTSSSPSRARSSCRPTSRVWPTASSTTKAPVTVFYNVFAKDTGAAAAIVAEQMNQLQEAPLWPFIKEVCYATIGPDVLVAHARPYVMACA